MADVDDAANNDLRIAQFSTDAFPEHQRVAAWREAFGRTVLSIDIAPASAEGFSASAKLVRCGDLGLMRATTAAARQWNTRDLITNDNISFGAITTSQWGASQLGRDVDLHPGDGLLLSNADVGCITLPEKCRYLVFSVPKSAIAPLLSDIGAHFGRRIPAATPALQMLLRYLDLAQEELLATSPELRATFTNHVCDLLALTLGATRDATERAKTRGVTAARLRAMKDDIRKASARADLSVHTIAQRHGVSARYVQRIFEESGSTFTQYLTKQRLAAAYNALRRGSDVPISTIAYECGFTDISHFNRVFRQQFNCTPTDIRNAARSKNV